MRIESVDCAAVLAAAMSGTAQKIGRLSLRVERGDATLEWTMPTGPKATSEHSLRRGQIRFVAEMPVHARPKIAMLVGLLIAVGVAVIVGLVALAVRGTELPVSVISFVSCLPIFAAIGIGIQLLRVRERLEIDSRILLASDEPYDFVVCRRDVGRLAEIPQSGGIIERWAYPRVALEAPGSSGAQSLPLCGSGLVDMELGCLIDTANAFMGEVRAEEGFDCSKIEAHPGVAALTALRGLG